MPAALGAGATSGAVTAADGEGNGMALESATDSGDPDTSGRSAQSVSFARHSTAAFVSSILVKAVSAFSAFSLMDLDAPWSLLRRLP
jgi:hypothetical protein